MKAKPKKQGRAPDSPALTTARAEIERIKAEAHRSVRPHETWISRAWKWMGGGRP